MSLTPVPQPQQTALIYVRVSTKEQAQGGGEVDGFSLPAQRDACRRKASSLNASVVAEFVDRGESARTADRPELQRMLQHLATEHVDYVIVHKIDRLARNRSDDVALTAAITASGAKLVSVTENIDETPSGLLLHGIMSSIAEFYSRNLSNEVIKGTQQKVRAGGTPTRAPIGYRNVRRLVDGYEVRTVDLDPERAPLITWAFEQYATGEWSLRSLADELRVRGLTFRPGPKTPAREVPANKLHAILRNRYYIGYVTWRGVEHEGKHRPLIDTVTFESVQRVLAEHRTSGERAYRRDHYLVGSLRCGICGRKLLYTVSTGKQGREYGYFYCASRVGGAACGQRYLPEALVEDAVERQWQREVVPLEDVALLRTDLTDTLAAHERQSQQRAELLTRQMHAIKRERFKWAEKSMAGAVPDDIAADKQRQLATQLLRKETELAQQRQLEDVHRQALEQVLSVLANAGQAYAHGDGNLRRSMNQAWFDALYIDEDGGGLRVSDAGHNELSRAVAAAVVSRVSGTDRQKRRQRDSDGVDPVGVSNFALLVDGPRVLVLAGQAWRVTHIDWKRHRCWVEAAEQRGRMRWQSQPQPMAFEMCRGREVLLGREPAGRLSQRARTALAQARDSAESTVTSDATVVNCSSAWWWTWAGARANATIAAALPELVDARSRYENDRLRLRGDVGVDDIAAAVAELDLQALPAPEVDPAALRGLKFSEALPPPLALDTLAARMADRSAAAHVLAEPRRQVPCSRPY